MSNSALVAAYSAADHFIPGKHQSFIATAYFATNPMVKIMIESLSICGLYLMHVISVPVVPYNPVN
jgi:hypothetical protein